MEGRSISLAPSSFKCWMSHFFLRLILLIIIVKCLFILAAVFLRISPWTPATRRSSEKYFSVGIKTGFFHSSLTRDALTQGMCFWCGKTMVGRCFAIKLRVIFFWCLCILRCEFCVLLSQASRMNVDERRIKGVKNKWNRFSNGKNSGFLSNRIFLEDEKRQRHSLALETLLAFKLFVFVWDELKHQ